MALSDHLFSIMRRSELRISGNSGKVPDAIAAVLGEGVLANDPAQTVDVRSSPATGAMEVKLRYNARDASQQDGTVVRRITVDKSDQDRIATVIQRERKRAGLCALNNEDLIVAVAEVVEHGSGEIEKPELLFRPRIDIVDYKAGILKIAYELAFLWLGESYLEDSTAAKLREVILKQVDAAASGLLGKIEFGVDNDAVRLWAAERSTHIAYANRVQDHICVCVKIFDMFSGVVPVTRSASSYVQGPFDPDRIKFISIDSVTGRQRNSSFLDEMGRFVR